MFRIGELATDVGSIITGSQAVSLGLIDRLGGLSDALSYLHREIDRNKKKTAKAHDGQRTDQA
jgi:ClpP class serine protease